MVSRLLCRAIERSLRHVISKRSANDLLAAGDCASIARAMQEHRILACYIALRYKDEWLLPDSPSFSDHNILYQVRNVALKQIKNCRYELHQNRVKVPILPPQKPVNKAPRSSSSKSQEQQWVESAESANLRHFTQHILPSDQTDGATRPSRDRRHLP